jgi:molecular chaperone HtpG
MTTKGQSPAEQFPFQAEVSRLLGLMIHSVYTEKEIFLRELISNASDACDRLRYGAVTDANLLKDDPDLKITITIDKADKSLAVADNGIGMDRHELADNLGTIARSGTKAFLDQLSSADEGARLIGQFGVGFYSAFMVAERVEVLSRKAGSSEVHKWTSDGAGGFSIEGLAEEDAVQPGRGTRVLLRLKPDALTFLDAGEIERIVKTYSDHIPFPIDLIDVQKSEDEPNRLNSASAIWTRSPKELTEEDYKSFYRHVAAQFDEPALTIHYRAEGRHEYAVLLFVPTMPPFDLFDPQRKGRIRLYVRRVFVSDDADLLPAYLRFMRGVIDFQDMPLNISREMLQKNPIVAAIRKAVTNCILSELKKFAEKDSDAYLRFWEQFGAVLKEGIYEDSERRDDFYGLARFRSTAGDGWRSLKAYAGDLKDNQTSIYYLIGESLDQLRASPQLEGFRARGVEVLLLTDPVDNFWVMNAVDFDGKPFQSVSQGVADLSVIPLIEETKGEEETESSKSRTAVLLAKLKEVLEPAISDVRRSGRLVESPACLVAPSGGPDRGLDKIIGRQQGPTALAPVLEVNISHPFLKALGEKSGSDKAAEFEDWAWLLFDEARILEGELPADPAKFSERLNRLLLAAL